MNPDRRAPWTNCPAWTPGHDFTRCRYCRPLFILWVFGESDRKNRIASRDQSSILEVDMEKMPLVTKQPASIDFVVEVIRKMDPAEFRESLVRAGIIDEDGKLTEKYRSKDR